MNLTTIFERYHKPYSTRYAFDLQITAYTLLVPTILIGGIHIFQTKELETLYVPFRYCLLHDHRAIDNYLLKYRP